MSWGATGPNRHEVLLPATATTWAAVACITSPSSSQQDDMHGLKLLLSSAVIVSAHNLPKASAQWGKYALGVSDVWDECNGLLRAQPFEKAYHANEIIIMFQPSSGTFRVQVLTDSLMTKAVRIWKV
ncbi:TPA: hypothetical protein ACH3X1_011388 [Trebouxia sp. C0004]